MDVLNSGVALAVNNVVKEKNSVMINSARRVLTYQRAMHAQHRALDL